MLGRPQALTRVIVLEDIVDSNRAHSVAFRVELDLETKVLLLRNMELDYALVGLVRGQLLADLSQVEVF